MVGWSDAVKVGGCGVRRGSLGCLHARRLALSGRPPLGAAQQACSAAHQPCSRAAQPSHSTSHAAQQDSPPTEHSRPPARPWRRRSAAPRPRARPHPCAPAQHGPGARQGVWRVSAVYEAQPAEAAFSSRGGLPMPSHALRAVCSTARQRARLRLQVGAGDGHLLIKDVARQAAGAGRDSKRRQCGGVGR